MVSGGQQSIGYQCLGCGEKFLTWIDLIEHMSSVTRSEGCPKRLISLFVHSQMAVDAESEQFYVHRMKREALTSPRSSMIRNDTMRAKQARPVLMPTKASSPGGVQPSGGSLPISS